MQVSASVALWQLMQQTHAQLIRFSPDEKKFLFDIVANKRNGLDVDKSEIVHDKLTISSN
jgi:hypothetical protein